MIFECFAHLPGVRLDGVDQYRLCDGALTHLPFKIWHALDGTFAYEWKGFEKAAPVFFHMSAELGEDQGDAWLRSVHITLQDLHLSLLLQPGYNLLPDPRESCLYFCVDGKPLPPRAGPMNREWIVYGNVWHYDYDPAALQRADVLFKFLRDFTAFNHHGDLVRSVAVLKETAAVDYAFKTRRATGGAELDYGSGFLRIVELLEDILLPDDKSERFDLSLTKAFGYYLAVLVQLDLTQFDETAQQFSALYTLRSQLVHGELSDEAEMADREPYFVHGRNLLSVAIVKLMLIYKSGFSSEPLQRILTGCLTPGAGGGLPRPARPAELQALLFDGTG